MTEIGNSNIQKTQSILLKLKSRLNFYNKKPETASKPYQHNNDCETTNGILEFMKMKKEKERIELINLTKFILNYVRDNNLYNPDTNVILPDDGLSKLLNLNDVESVGLTHFNIHTYILRCLR